VCWPSSGLAREGNGFEVDGEGALHDSLTGRTGRRLGAPPVDFASQRFGAHGEGPHTLVLLAFAEKPQRDVDGAPGSLAREDGILSTCRQGESGPLVRLSMPDQLLRR
jgi:hypothetical protein